MLAAKSLETSLLGVLRVIGEYYQADRVYSLMLAENRHTVIMTFEWTSGSKRSIQQVVSGMPLERFPLLLQCMRERAPFILARQISAEPDGKEATEYPWHFTAFPLSRNPQQAVEGFLCIENARKHPADAAVFSTLTPFMLQQRGRFSDEELSSTMTERLAGMPELRGYIEVNHTLNSEYYSSMGVVGLNIPELATANSRLGYEYGSKMLGFVANTLTELFDPALLFQTQEAEFVAFYPNTTREVFLGCCGRLWSILQRHYPKQMRMGQAWSDGTFTGKHLAEETDAAAKNIHAESFVQDLPTLFNIDPVAGETLQSTQFTFYFQPKVDMRTGVLAGAEALVRRIGEDGSIVPPSQFIPLMEEIGTIRKLDLFVLERSLAQVEQWRASGLGIVPVSVNLSRTTLAYPTTLASILAIQSHYPDIPGSALELEITEHGNEMETSQLQELVERFRACGLHMSLDDLGSLYANLSLFIKVKFGTVKMDRNLIIELIDNPIGRRVVRELVQICQTYCITYVAVVLSGTGSDGTNGVKAVKEHGGLVITQAPESAKFDGMPRNVINTGLADFVLSPEEIAEEIMNFSNTPVLLRPLRSDGLQSEDESLFSEEETLSHIYTILKNASGIDFTYYKCSTILRRIERRMLVTHTSGLPEFARLLGDNQEEVNTLVKEILIGVTNFFRDPAFFEKLKYNAIYKIVERARENEPIRVWSASCSTGEETYYLAILFQEVVEEMQVKRDVKIFATDVDSRAIEQAGKGVFSENIIDDVTHDRLAKYFIKVGDQYHISKSIRRMIVFATHNMFSDPPFGKLDLISCRNVMIYFQPVMRRGLFAIFHSTLKNGGFLFLGKSETAGEYVNLFKPVCIAEKIYLHKSEGQVEDLASPTFNILNIQNISLKNIHAGLSQNDEIAVESRYTRFLEQHLPASVVLGEDDKVLHFFGNYNDYLTLAPGKASLNFFSMLCKDLSLVAATAVSRCRTEHVAVTYTDIVVDTPSGRKVINLTVEPIPAQEGENELVAVLFLNRADAEEAEGMVEKYDLDATAARRIADLEREFQVSRRDLRSTIQRLETVNEELYTVNTEHQLKLDELTTMTNDLSNFLSSTMIGILFVDGDLNIRKFTEYVGREFRLMDHDVGRPIQIFAHGFPEEAIEADCKTVLRNLVSIDREVTAMNGRCYTLCIAPYRTTDNNIHGLVITIIDSLGTSIRNEGGAG